MKLFPDPKDVIPFAEPRPQSGEWWYTVRCDECDNHLAFMQDMTCGVAAIPLLKGTVELRCAKCGLAAPYAAEDFKSRQVGSVNVA